MDGKSFTGLPHFVEVVKIFHWSSIERFSMDKRPCIGLVCMNDFSQFFWMEGRSSRDRKLATCFPGPDKRFSTGLI